MRRKIVRPHEARLRTTGIPRLPASLHSPPIRRPPLAAWSAKAMAYRCRRWAKRRYWRVRHHTDGPAKAVLKVKNGAK